MQKEEDSPESTCSIPFLCIVYIEVPLVHGFGCCNSKPILVYIVISAKVCWDEHDFKADANYEDERELLTRPRTTWLKLNALHIIKTLDILSSNGYWRNLYAHQNHQRHYRVKRISFRAGLVVISVFSIINIFAYLTFKIFLIPSPVFIGYSSNNTVHSDSS